MDNSLETWHFGTDNDHLVELVLSGKKVATCSLHDDNSPKVGEESILIFDNEKKACVTKTKEVFVLPFKDITWDLACLEGETTTLEEWKKIHIDFFLSIDPNFNDETIVDFEIFEVTRNLIEERLLLANTLVSVNKDIFGEVKNISEINAGFNNSIFDIDDKYIIKVCGNDKEENLFDVENNFYVSNSNSCHIPKLYRYDNSKKDVPYVYEILEKISGKSVYYFWYKWDEDTKRLFIKNLMHIIRELHSKEYPEYNFAKSVRTEVSDNFNKCLELFTDEEIVLMNKSLSLYNKYLSDNRFSLIHNDLHFDNIIIDNDNNIKLIDFNDSIVAPFDYDLRILFMCKTMPWKWANIEMDPYQKPKDYENIIDYILEYYPELNNVKYLNERMIIYEILNDVRHLPRFRSQELRDRIISNTNKLLESHLFLSK